MTDREPTHSAPSDAEEMEQVRLSRAWNAYVTGDRSSLRALDVADAATIERLMTLASAGRPRPAFVRQVREQIMDEGNIAAVPGAVTDQTSPPPWFQPRAVAPRRTRDRWWQGSWNGVGTAAMVALLVMGLISGYLAISTPDNGNSPAGNGALTGESSPVPGGSEFLARYPDCGTYGPGCPAVQWRRFGSIINEQLSSDDLSAQRAELQDWRIDPGMQIALPADTTGTIHGAVVDFVLEGAYAMTLDTPAFIGRAPIGIEADAEYVVAGQRVELAQGDAISYAAGHARTIENLLSTRPVHLKSVVFSVGADAPVRPPDSIPTGLQFRVDGQGELPSSLSAYPSDGVNVTLEYIQVHDGLPLPDARYSQRRIIGPVDPIQPEITEGYVVWVGPGLG